MWRFLLKALRPPAAGAKIRQKQQYAGGKALRILWSMPLSLFPPSPIGHTPAALAKKGCSFMVRVKMRDLKNTLAIIDMLMLKTFGVYRRKGDGTYDILG